MCRTSLSLSDPLPSSLSLSPAADDRNDRKYVFRPCSLAFVPGRLRFSSGGNGRRSTECHANSSRRGLSFPDLSLRSGISMIQEVAAPMASLEGFGSRHPSCSPLSSALLPPHPFHVPRSRARGEFPGQETRNRYRLRNRGLRITGSTDPTESVSSASA